MDILILQYENCLQNIPLEVSKYLWREKILKKYNKTCLIFFSPSGVTGGGGAHMGKARVRLWMSSQFIPRPYASICGCGALLKGTLAVFWNLLSLPDNLLCRCLHWGWNQEPSPSHPSPQQTPTGPWRTTQMLYLTLKMQLDPSSSHQQEESYAKGSRNLT